jgi:hypothetical protein
MSVMVRRQCLFLALPIFAAFSQGCPIITPPPTQPGGGNFLARARLTVEGQPTALATADFNADTLPDLASANRETDSVTVLVALEDGEYRATSIEVGLSPAAIVAADLNADGAADLATANTADGTISVLLGQGNGGFAAPIPTELQEGSAPQAITAGLLNNDALADLIVADTALDTVSVLFSNIAGGILGGSVLPVGDAPRSVAAADVTADGEIDLLVANRDSDDVSLLVGNGDGTFQPQIRFGVGKSPRTVAVGLLNNDTLPDMVVSCPGDGVFTIRLNLGNRAFGPAQTLEAEGLPTRFVLSDFDRDSELDLAALLFTDTPAEASLGLVQVFYGEGNGSFEKSRTFSAGSAALDVLAADIDKDNRVDVLTTEPGRGTISIAYGRTDGFETDERFLTGELPRVVVPGDFNNDADVDLAVANLTSETVTILAGAGDGTFTLLRTLELDDTPRALAVGDVNNDDDLDLAVTNLNTNRVSIFLGRGDGRFEVERKIPVRPAGETGRGEPRSVALADMNGDDDLDLIVGNASADRVAILLGSGNGVFGNATEFFAGAFPLDVHAVDMNGDDFLDIVVANGEDPDDPGTSAPRVNVVFGKGDGTLIEDTRTSYATGSLPRALAIGDLNGDTFPDVVTAHETGNRVFLLQGGEDGALVPGRGLPAGTAPNSVDIADVNGDRRPDIIATNDNDEVNLLLNRSLLLFAAPVAVSIGDNPIGGIAVDVDADQKPDVVTANRGSNDVSVLLHAQ